MGKEEKMSVNRDMNKEEKLKALDAALTQMDLTLEKLLYLYLPDTFFIVRTLK